MTKQNLSANRDTNWTNIQTTVFTTEILPSLCGGRKKTFAVLQLIATALSILIVTIPLSAQISSRPGVARLAG